LRNTILTNKGGGSRGTETGGDVDVAYCGLQRDTERGKESEWDPFSRRGEKGESKGGKKVMVLPGKEGSFQPRLFG